MNDLRPCCQNCKMVNPTADSSDVELRFNANRAAEDVKRGCVNTACACHCCTACSSGAPPWICTYRGCPCHWYENRTKQARGAEIVEPSPIAVNPQGAAHVCLVCRVGFLEPVVTLRSGEPVAGRRRTCPRCRAQQSKLTRGLTSSRRAPEVEVEIAIFFEHDSRCADPLGVHAACPQRAPRVLGAAVHHSRCERPDEDHACCYWSSAAQEPPRNDQPVGGQVRPVPSGERPSWAVVIDDMKVRDDHGRQKYGTPLQPNNGRDSLWDAYEESLDQTVYLRNAIDEHRARIGRLEALITAWRKHPPALTPPTPLDREWAARETCADELERALRGSRG
jgi:hypothetical protein